MSHRHEQPRNYNALEATIVLGGARRFLHDRVCLALVVRTALRRVQLVVAAVGGTEFLSTEQSARAPGLCSGQMRRLRPLSRSCAVLSDHHARVAPHGGWPILAERTERERLRQRGRGGCGWSGVVHRGNSGRARVGAVDRCVSGCAGGLSGTGVMLVAADDRFCTVTKKAMRFRGQGVE